LFVYLLDDLLKKRTNPGSLPTREIREVAHLAKDMRRRYQRCSKPVDQPLQRTEIFDREILSAFETLDAFGVNQAYQQ
jgi:hypothetical protein